MPAIARNLIEIGEFDEAWDLALEASLIGRREYQDPTARYVAGVAMEFVFQLNDLTGRQEAENLFRTIMKYSPDSSSWLRTQILAGGLTDFSEKNYPQSRDDAKIILGKECAGICSEYSAGSWGSRRVRTCYLPVPSFWACRTTRTNNE